MASHTVWLSLAVPFVVCVGARQGVTRRGWGGAVRNLPNLFPEKEQPLFNSEPSLNNRIDRLERLIEGLHQKQDALGRATQHTEAMLTDVMYGVDATGKPAEQALIASQRRRGLLPPTEPVSTNGR